MEPLPGPTSFGPNPSFATTFDLKTACHTYGNLLWVFSRLTGGSIRSHLGDVHTTVGNSVCVRSVCATSDALLLHLYTPFVLGYLSCFSTCAFTEAARTVSLVSPTLFPVTEHGFHPFIGDPRVSRPVDQLGSLFQSRLVRSRYLD